MLCRGVEEVFLELIQSFSSYTYYNVPKNGEPEMANYFYYTTNSESLFCNAFFVIL